MLAAGAWIRAGEPVVLLGDSGTGKTHFRDRAALRLLTRADAATASQLARLIYRRERTAQERLLQLMRAGALERMIVPRQVSWTVSGSDRCDSTGVARYRVIGGIWPRVSCGRTQLYSSR